MLALARQPHPSGMAAMQTINVVVFNPWFGGAFSLAPVACALAMITALALAGSQMTPWVSRRRCDLLDRDAGRHRAVQRASQRRARCHACPTLRAPRSSGLATCANGRSGITCEAAPRWSPPRCSRTRSSALDLSGGGGSGRGGGSGEVLCSGLAGRREVCGVEANRDRIYGDVFRRRLATMGIAEVVSAPASPGRILRGATDPISPAGMPEPCDRTRRAAPATSPVRVSALLPWGAHSSLPREGRTHATTRPRAGGRSRNGIRGSGRTSPSLRTTRSLTFSIDQRVGVDMSTSLDPRPRVPRRLISAKSCSSRLLWATSRCAATVLRRRRIQGVRATLFSRTTAVVSRSGACRLRCVALGSQGCAVDRTVVASIQSGRRA